MNSNQIFKLLRDRIPQSHPLKFQVHDYHRVENKFLPPINPFVSMLCDTLAIIEKVVPDYSMKMINRIGETESWSQIYSNLAEVLVFAQAVQIADEQNGHKYIVSEPQSIRNGKNPEFRSKAFGHNYAAEVKAADIMTYMQDRKSRYQLTSHLQERELLSQENPLKSKVLTVKDFLVSAEGKYKEYTKSESYQDDFRFLFIVWDDHANEVMAALLNPANGLFTENTFVEGKPRFELIDGVFIIRHLHQFRRSIQGKEFLNDVSHAFQMITRQVPVAFVQNPCGRKVPMELIHGFGAELFDASSSIVSEYKATDWVDWGSGLAVAGLSCVPMEYHKDVLDVMKGVSDHLGERIEIDSANFTTINLERIASEHSTDNVFDKNGFLSHLKKVAEVSARMQRNAILIEKNQLEDTENRKREYLAGLISDFRNVPKENVSVTTRKKGRNEPCFCGSGLKYKRCCLK
ncbi:SEC-C metal-binding domain-containing protein [Paenibacillus sp. PL91]|uniref:SEC-C metal-binding domain-containing protein n=1 Tax=Paenibacillus sp. PL91 TaxID=2729538 RepID=UPI00145E78BF|nr:SEC-C metal-binding domain-containing protein [Paenibacillus sp. PL91]MBC9199791.1 SEC-C domain-containing protein [Paenibacillus sp. PL91]